MNKKKLALLIGVSLTLPIQAISKQNELVSYNFQKDENIETLYHQIENPQYLKKTNLT